MTKEQTTQQPSRAGDGVPVAKRLHAKDTDFGVANIGFSICGIYSFQLVDDHNLVTCRNCLTMLAKRKT